MIILSVGMPRAGSGWYYNLTHDLVKAGGGQDARWIRSRYHLQSILTEVNCNIGALTARRLGAVLIPSLLGNRFAIKAHAGPTFMAKSMLRLGLLKAAYIYRDPRDALISAYDSGQRSLQKGRSNAFSSLVDFETSVQFMQEYVRISEDWLALSAVLHSCYESLVNDYFTETSRMIQFLGLGQTDSAIQAVIEKYQPAAARSDQKGMHFNQGRSGRFREKTTPEQQKVMEEVFKPYLIRMGYPL